VAKADKKVAEKEVARKQSMKQTSVARPEKKAADKKAAEKKATHQPPNRIQRYFRETIGELRKVSWPTRQEAINLTIVVLIVIIGMSTFLGVLDFLFSRFFALVLGT
jgi:preprotein translocase subunit SecE